jgi:hypothetical protein
MMREVYSLFFLFLLLQNTLASSFNPREQQPEFGSVVTGVKRERPGDSPGTSYHEISRAFWFNVTLNEPFEHDQRKPLQVSRLGLRVIFKGEIRAAAPAVAGQPIFTLPPAAWPMVTEHKRLHHLGAKGKARVEGPGGLHLSIGSDGVAHLSADSAQGAWHAGFAYNTHRHSPRLLPGHPVVNKTHSDRHHSRAHHRRHDNYLSGEL